MMDAAYCHLHTVDTTLDMSSNGTTTLDPLAQELIPQLSAVYAFTFGWEESLTFNQPRRKIFCSFCSRYCELSSITDYNF